MSSSAMSHHSHEIYTKNAGECCLQPPMPLPPQEGFPFEMKEYQDVNEPKYIFCKIANIHKVLKFLKKGLIQQHCKLGLLLRFEFSRQKSTFESEFVCRNKFWTEIVN